MTLSDRPAQITLGRAVVPIPGFFASVSSIKTNRCPVDYVHVLTASARGQFLVSAYDMAQSADSVEISEAVGSAIKQGTTVLLDSGNYESHWMQDGKWTQVRFHDVLRANAWPIAFSYDRLCALNGATNECADLIGDN